MSRLLVFVLASLVFLLSAGLTSAQITRGCNHDFDKFHGCPPGYVCLPDNICGPIDTNIQVLQSHVKADANIVDKHSPIVSRGYGYCASTGPRMDGRCGSDWEGATCNPSGPFGGCCSADGYCTSCNDKSRRQLNYCASTGPRMDARCGCDWEGATCDPSGPFGGCCSADGWCTSCNNKREAKVDTHQPFNATHKPTYSTNGRCGTTNNNTLCVDSTAGACCSVFGYCGDTAAHCGAGCQSGSCADAPTNEPDFSMSTTLATITGRPKHARPHGYTNTSAILSVGTAAGNKSAVSGAAITTTSSHVTPAAAVTTGCKDE